jgi:hypothetical protein
MVCNATLQLQQIPLPAGNRTRPQQEGGACSQKAVFVLHLLKTALQKTHSFPFVHCMLQFIDAAHLAAPKVYSCILYTAACVYCHNVERFDSRVTHPVLVASYFF